MVLLFFVRNMVSRVYCPLSTMDTGKGIHIVFCLLYASLNGNFSGDVSEEELEGKQDRFACCVLVSV